MSYRVNIYVMNISTVHHDLVCQGPRVPSPTYNLGFRLLGEQLLQRRAGLGQICPHSLREVRNVKSISASLEPFKCRGNLKIVFWKLLSRLLQLVHWRQSEQRILKSFNLNIKSHLFWSVSRALPCWAVFKLGPELSSPTSPLPAAWLDTEKNKNQLL